jgi:hypothetical protein
MSPSLKAKIFPSRKDISCDQEHLMHHLCGIHACFICRELNPCSRRQFIYAARNGLFSPEYIAYLEQLTRELEALLGELQPARNEQCALGILSELRTQKSLPHDNARLFLHWPMKLFVAMSAGLQDAGEKPAVVSGERLLRPWCGTDGDSCVIRRRQSRSVLLLQRFQSHASDHIAV